VEAFEINRQTVDVTRSRARSRSQDHLVALEILNNLVYQRINRGASPVHDTLAADFDDVDPRQDGEVRRPGSGAHKSRIGK